MTRSINLIDTAKIVRKLLRRLFPGVVFSVTTRRYRAGDGSICVVWTDGPWRDDVDRVLRPFASSGFDGTIDLAFDVEAFLLPDGSAVVAQSAGTIGSGGVCPPIKAFKPSAAAERVCFGSRHILVMRKTDKPIAAVGRSA
ncbi:LPD29 domain-containing protein [Metarhizobium album]|uniref:LPD29 domain-containing protein n=1 Tax=Metarhizobium album TaxID=2182425 RepID=UPI000FFF15A0|nr:LPD29 domain-containing protein [Rhizobium album]